MKRITMSMLVGVALSFSQAAFAQGAADEKEFMKNFDKEFMSSCVAQSGANEICECALTNIKKDVSYKELKSMEEGTATENDQKKIVEKVISATMSCAPK